MRDAFAALTIRGRAFVAAGLTCMVCSVLLGQKDLLPVGILVLLLPVITVVLIGRARYRLSCVRSLTPSRIAVGQPTRVTLQLQNTGRLPSSLVRVEDQVPYVLGSRPRFVLDETGPRWHRDINYTVRSEVRGRFTLGPLRVRISDPFGLIELTRGFQARNVLTVTPQVHQLSHGHLGGEWSGTGDNRPRAFAAAGAEDVTVREYRDGDDLRRVHWPSSARLGELMVRREEQPFQSRATLIMDTRASAHRGSGPGSSFEWMVTAAASIGVHLAREGYALRLVSESGDDPVGQFHDRGSGAVGDSDDLLDRLAVIDTSSRRTLELPRSRDDRSGVIVAILGLLEASDLSAVRRLAQGAAAGYAIVIDVSGWAGAGSGERAAIQERVQRTVAELRANRWRVVVATPQDRVALLWSDLLTPLRGFTVPAGDTP
ncbi:MAG TPA: DUF58 domain-containing protein [Nocardioidaceae bacterium]|nr:DUF58 domain-containing protein [Nocardioidaceae bacterium]